jgi:hypothetical protein
MYEYIFVYIVLPLIIIIIKIFDFFVGNIFSIFFSCTFEHPRYGSLYAIFGTPCICKITLLDSCQFISRDKSTYLEKFYEMNLYDESERKSKMVY